MLVMLVVKLMGWVRVEGRRRLPARRSDVEGTGRAARGLLRLLEVMGLLAGWRVGKRDLGRMGLTASGAGRNWDSRQDGRRLEAREDFVEGERAVGRRRRRCCWYYKRGVRCWRGCGGGRDLNGGGRAGRGGERSESVRGRRLRSRRGR